NVIALSVFCMSQTVKSHQLLLSVLKHRNPYHIRPVLTLSVDLFDLNLGIALSVAVFLMVTGFSLVLVNDHFFRASVLYNGSLNSSVLNGRISNLQTVVADC